MGRLLGILSFVVSAFAANLAYDWLRYGGGPDPDWQRVPAETVPSLYRNATHNYRSTDSSVTKAYFRQDGTAEKALGLGKRLKGTWRMARDRLCIIRIPESSETRRRPSPAEFGRSHSWNFL